MGWKSELTAAKGNRRSSEKPCIICTAVHKRKMEMGIV